ncbi:hypothetical protein OQA88_4819 [Cercophora sp. LCS_1]
MTTRSQAKKQGQAEVAPASESHPGSKRRTTVEEAPEPEPEPKRTKQNKEGYQREKSAKKEDISEAEPDRGNGTAVEPHGREAEEIPSSILEKGIIYFFFRGRVGIDEPSDVKEIARSFLLLRPIDRDAKLGEGVIGDAGNSRLFAIPKKILPQTGRDRWISFVEKCGASFQQLKEEFLSSKDYDTKTAGERHSPAATPVGEGVYAITSTGRESHLAYILTIPKTLGEVQKEIGLKEKGSFIISTKNPGYPSPPNARLPKGPEYPKEILEEFRSLRWLPTKPMHLDYANAQILMIGESSGIEKALEPQKEDQQKGVEDPAEEMEKLEEEDCRRMKGLSKDDSTRIFSDLEVNAKDYPKLQTTF